MAKVKEAITGGFATAEEIGFDAPVTRLFEKLYIDSVDHRLGDLDYAGLFVELASRNGMR